MTVKGEGIAFRKEPSRPSLWLSGGFEILWVTAVMTERDPGRMEAREHGKHAGDGGLEIYTWP